MTVEPQGRFTPSDKQIEAFGALVSDVYLGPARRKRQEVEAMLANIYIDEPKPKPEPAREFTKIEIAKVELQRQMAQLQNQLNALKLV